MKPCEVWGSVTTDHQIHLPPGLDFRKTTGKVEVARANATIGGGGFNLARGLVTLDQPVDLVGPLARASRRQLGEQCPAIGTSRCREANESPVSFILRRGNEQVILVKRAAAKLEDTRDYLIQSTNPLVITPQPRANNEDILWLLANLPTLHEREGDGRADWAGRPILWLPGAHQFDIVKAGLATGRVTCLVCNDAEAMQITGADSPEVALVVLKHYASEKTEVVITCRVRVVAFAGGHYYFQNSFKPDAVVDVTGCGDSFAAAYFGSRLHGEDVPAALLNGLANAASVLGHMGASAGHLSRQEMEEFRRTHAQVADEPGGQPRVLVLEWVQQRASRLTALAAMIAVMIGVSVWCLG
jgi:sugar/nucleoside kinase (ribokinase family)